MRTYRTYEVAQIIGIHVNTVRLYEACGLIQEPERESNGYRIFTDLHIEQFRLARAALQVEVLQNGLRKQAVEIIKLSASGDLELARQCAQRYLLQVEMEISHAQEAILIAREFLDNSTDSGMEDFCGLTHKEAAAQLKITSDTLRNWERNGLIEADRGKNRYRIYSDKDMKRLKMIRSLRCANYSLAAILRMLLTLSGNPEADVEEVLDTPDPEDDIVAACDQLLTSLEEAGRNMSYVISQIDKMEQMKKIKVYT